MGSQQARQTGERRGLISLAPATEEPREHNSTRYQALRADHLLANVDQHLYDVSAIVGNARKVLHDCGAVLTTSNVRCSEYEQAYQQERQRRIDQDRQYAGLFNQHQKAINDIQDISYKCLELQQQLESNREARDANSSMIQEKGQLSEVDVARVAGKGRELSQSGCDMAEAGIEDEQLKDRVGDLEQENAGMRQDNEKGLTNAVDHIHTVSQKVDKEEMMRQSMPAEQIPASVFVKAENDDNSGSSSQPQRGRAKRVRKTKQAAGTE